MNVHQVQATCRAFAAVLENRTVVTWGDPKCGGDSSSVQDRLRNVQHVHTTESAFAAILDNGSPDPQRDLKIRSPRTIWDFI